MLHQSRKNKSGVDYDNDWQLTAKNERRESC